MLVMNQVVLQRSSVWQAKQSSHFAYKAQDVTVIIRISPAASHILKSDFAQKEKAFASNCYSAQTVEPVI